MSAEILRRAAREIRDDHEHYTPKAGEEAERFFHLAVANWLEAVATRAEEMGDTLIGSSDPLAQRVIGSNVTGYREALAAARAYLGESA